MTTVDDEYQGYYATFIDERLTFEVAFLRRQLRELRQHAEGIECRLRAAEHVDGTRRA